MKNILPIAFLRTILNALKAASAPLDAVTIRLFSNDFQPDDASVLADFTEADFDGYLESAAVVWEDAYTDINGLAHLRGDLKVFNCTGGTTPNTIYGWYAVTTTTLKLSQRFETPIPINAAGQAVLVLPSFELASADSDPVV